MPGLCGIVAAPNQRVDAKLWERAVRAHALSEIAFVDRHFASERCLLGSVSSNAALAGGQTADFVRRATLVAFMEGELYEQDELRSRFRSEAETAPAVLLDGYCQLGEACLEHVNGEFNFVVYDSSEHSLTVFADHLASQPMYYIETPEGLVFGSEKKLLQALTDTTYELDALGVMQMFTHVHNVGDRTFVKGMRRFEPGTRLRYVDGRLTLSLGNLIEFSPQQRSRTQTVDEWEAQLRVATAHRTPQNRSVQVSLSAGLDSRAIICAIDRQHRPIHARTWGIEQSLEVRYATEIARLLGFEHFIENPLNFRHSQALRPVVWRTEGEIQYRNGISMFSHRKMRGRGDYVAGGWLGDASSGAHLRPFMFRKRSRAAFLERVFGWYCTNTPESLSRVFQPAAVAEHFPNLRELFFKSYDRLADLDNVTAQEYWDLYHRQTRMTISSMPVDSHLFQKVRPFFDRRYLEFVMSLPMRHRIGQSVYKAVIFNLGPEIRAVPNSNTNQRLSGSVGRNFVDYLWANRRKVYRKVAAKMGIGYNARPWVGAEDLANSVRRDASLGRCIENFLVSDYCDRKLFNEQGIRKLLDEHYRGSADHSVTISILATYAVALPYFVYDRPAACPDEAHPDAIHRPAAAQGIDAET